jgi:hypothetical protein
MCGPSARIDAGEQSAFEQIIGSRRSWRRLAKRATAAYERDLARLARRIAAAAPPVRVATSRPLRGTGDSAVAVLTLALPGWELELSGVAAGAATELASGAAASPHLTRTGRYGSFWWIEISDRSTSGLLVLLGSQLRLSATGEGEGPGSSLTPPLELAGSRR